MTFGLTGVAEEALSEIRRKSRAKVHKRDPVAWYWDVLGGKWWSKQEEIAWAVMNPDTPQSMVLVRSCNGIGKTKLAADIGTYYLATQDPFETSIIATAPVFSQITTGLFRYISENYSVARKKGFNLPGRFVADPAIKVPRAEGGLDHTLMQGRRPADNNLISSFQGIHNRLVVVLMDEAGGLPEDLYIGANAVTTNEYAKILAIGNPDALHTPFHHRFKDRDKFRDWETFTISAYDSPNLTGEIIHPDPEEDERIKSHLVQRSWVEMMERQAHPNVVRAKVHGEFPLDDDTSFFSQLTINKAYDTEVEPGEDDFRYMGIDLAFGGEDRTAVYVNHGGRIREVEQIPYMEDYMALARKIHQIAISHGVDELRLDAGGSGKGVFSLLDTQDEFSRAPYTLLGILGGTGSPDNTQWAQARAWHYDSFRSQMSQGLVDLDPEDHNLRDDMNSVTYEINRRGAIQITPKHEARKKGIRSPDHLDAAIYSAIDFSGALEGPQPGTKVSASPEQLIEDIGFEMNWLDLGGAF